MRQDSTPDSHSSAPEPSQQFYIEQGWTRKGNDWLKPNGEPVFLVDIINAYPPLKAWVMEKTNWCRDGQCAATSIPCQSTQERGDS